MENIEHNQDVTKDAEGQSRLNAGLCVTNEMIDRFLMFTKKASYLNHPNVPYYGTVNGDSEEKWTRRYIAEALKVALTHNVRVWGAGFASRTTPLVGHQVSLPMEDKNMREALSKTDEKGPHVWVDVQDMKVMDCKDLTAEERHKLNDEAQAVGEFYLQWMTEETYEKALNGIPEGEWIFVWGHTEQKWFILNQKGALLGEAGSIGEAESRVNMRGMEIMEIGKSGKSLKGLMQKIGSKGGTKSRRVLTPEQAKKMVEAREKKRKEKEKE